MFGLEKKKLFEGLYTLLAAFLPLNIVTLNPNGSYIHTLADKLVTLLSGFQAPQNIIQQQKHDINQSSCQRSL